MESQLHRQHEDNHPQGGGESEHHHEGKMSALKKVKEKAKKIKNTVTKHGHGQGLASEGDGKHNQVLGAPTCESTVIKSKDLPQEEAMINQELNKKDDTNKSNNQNSDKEMDHHSKDHNSDQKPQEKTAHVTFEQAPPPPRVSENKESGNKSDTARESVEPQKGTTEDANITAEPDKSEARHDKPITETVSEYAHMIAEKLKPGEEEKALSESVTNTLEKAAEGVHLKGSKEEGPQRLGEVRESDEVKARLGPIEENKREGKDAFVSGVESSGDSVADRVKDAVGAWLRKSEGTQTAKQSVGESYSNNG